MKNKHILGLLAFLLFSCGSLNNNTTSQEPTITPSTNIPLVELEEDEICEGGSYGGYFIEINVNRLLANDETYHCSFESSNPNKAITVVSTRPESVTIHYGTNPNRDIILKTHAPGDSIIKIYDADDMLVYRKVVRVRQAYTSEDIGDAIFENDSYLGMKFMGDHRMTFIENGPIVGIFSGSDDFETDMRIKFEANYLGYLEDRDAYEYSLDIVDRDAYSTTKITVLQVSRTADVMYLYYNSGSTDSLLNIFVAEPYAKFYEGML